MNRYFEQMIMSASPMELVRLLFQRAILSVGEAREHLSCGRIEERAQAISRVYNIVAELTGSLKADEAPELTARLRSLYCYVQQLLLDANMKQLDAPLAEAFGLLTTLAEGFAEKSEAPEEALPTGWRSNVAYGIGSMPECAGVAVFA